MKNLNLNVYMVTDHSKDNIEVLSSVGLAVKSGVNVIQYRPCKKTSKEDILKMAEEIKKLISLNKNNPKQKVLFLINDFPDVAKKMDADGVHLGQSDILNENEILEKNDFVDETIEDNTIKNRRKISTIRKTLGKDKIIGLSIGNISELNKSNLKGVDYIGVGPVYDTKSKSDAGKALNIKGFKELKKAIDEKCEREKIEKKPIVAIGGINYSNANKVIYSGADGIAMISYFSNNEFMPMLFPDKLKTLEKSILGIKFNFEEKNEHWLKKICFRKV